MDFQNTGTTSTESLVKQVAELREDIRTSQERKDFCERNYADMCRV